MKLVRYLRSLDTIPKWLIFVAVTGTALAWFYWLFYWPGRPWDESVGLYRRQWAWIIPTTSAVALTTYWALFGFKSSDKE